MSDEWKESELVHCVTDENGKEMWFRLSPARINPEKAPIFLLLHGHGTTSRASLYSEKHWNVISPVDNFGYEERGSWWTGEDGNLDTSNLLVDVVARSKQLLGLSEDAILCIYGSSMGGYGAITNGCILGAKAVYANVPQIKLLGSTYSELGMKKFFDAVLGSTPDPKYNDLNEFIRNFNGEFPLFFVCENRHGQKNYLREQAMSIINTFNDLDLNYHLEIVPTKGHNKNLGIREVRALFEKFIPELNHLLDKVDQPERRTKKINKDSDSQADGKLKEILSEYVRVHALIEHHFKN